MLSSALIFTVVGTGQASYSGDGDMARRAALNQPFDIALDGQGNLYFSDAHNHCVRRIERDSGTITTVAGTGQAGYRGDGAAATKAQLNSPYGIALDTADNLYIVDRLNACIRLVEAATGIIQTVAGTGQPGYAGDGGPASLAQLQEPNDIVLDHSGRAFIADVQDHRVRVVDLDVHKGIQSQTGYLPNLCHSLNRHIFCVFTDRKWQSAVKEVANWLLGPCASSELTKSPRSGYRWGVQAPRVAGGGRGDDSAVRGLLPVDVCGR